MYDPRSKCADRFIDHEEIMDTLAYAQAHKTDRELIDQILEKARERKLEPQRGVGPFRL